MSIGSADRVDGAPAEPVRSRSWRTRFAVLALVWSAWTVLAVELDLGTLRAVSVLLFVAVVPGAAVTSWLAVDDPVFEATLVLGIGAAVGVATGEILVWTGWWAPLTALEILAAACAISLGFRLHHELGRTAPEDVP
jgi:hypothetical protein